VGMIPGPSGYGEEGEKPVDGIKIINRLDRIVVAVEAGAVYGFGTGVRFAR
jgi:hypothetical protein